MTIPPTTLQKTLEPYPDTKELRTAEGSLDSFIAYTEAFGKAIRGEIEAVCSSSGRIRHFRLLPVEARPQEAPEREEQDTGRSTAFAKTHLGVFREPVREIAVSEHLGFRVAMASGEIVGHVYAHCGLRRAG